jgi:myo-inositol 2-dehydrogenase / D-chiro-inositol 1-dehydrogenase
MALSGGATGFVSLGRHYPPGDMARAEVFGTGGTIRCDFLNPADGERAQLDALRRQAEGFAAFARAATADGVAGDGGAAAGGGATAADAVAALRAAEQASAAIPALAAAALRAPA